MLQFLSLCFEFDFILVFMFPNVTILTLKYEFCINLVHKFQDSQAIWNEGNKPTLVRSGKTYALWLFAGLLDQNSLWKLQPNLTAFMWFFLCGLISSSYTIFYFVPVFIEYQWREVRDDGGAEKVSTTYLVFFFKGV